MKTKKYLIWMMMILSVLVIACDKDDEAEETCDSEDVSEDLSCPIDVNTIASFCSDGESDSYYVFNGNNYYCDGVSVETCDDALYDIGIALLEAGCGEKKSGNIENVKIKLSDMAKKLLEEVREESVCN